MAYLFTRRVVVSPAHIRAGMAHALSMLNMVKEKTKLDVSLFQVLQGEPLGTLMFASRSESYAASVDAADALVQSDEYMDKAEAGAQFYVGNPVDALGEFIHAAGEIEAPPAAVNVVSATLEVNRAGAAIAWSIELADYMHNLTALPVAVLTSNYGEYGRVAWATYGNSLAELEAGGKKSNADPGFIQRLGDSEGLFVPRSGTGALSRRLG